MFKENFLFEISWEVCNKVGGIHTVITSKISQIQKYFNNYFLIGPYLSKDYSNEFEEILIPKKFEKFSIELEQIGIKLHFGKWISQNNCKVILVEYLDYSKNINNIKKNLWENYKIDSLGSNWYDFDEAILWSWCCGITIETLCKCNFSDYKLCDENLLKSSSNLDKKILVHSHEWMSGGAIFYLKQIKNNDKFRTIFTTHATMLGRTISSNTKDLYDNLSNFNVNELSYKYNIYTKHQCEKSLANISDCFTTVSKITNNEAKYFYEKSADILLSNGFNIPLFLNENEIEFKFNESRNLINDFLENYSKDYQDLNLKDSKIFYTSGRNEFYDKGVDIYIKALGKLNEKLKNENSNKNIINLFLIPINDFPKEDKIESSNILPFSTHKIPLDNQIIKAFFENKLFNFNDDNVKVIVLPFYLNENDKILNKNYYKIINGLDLGIFPSLYEPWGYTPLESISFAVPTITSNFAGFGKYIQENFSIHKGVFVIDRNKKKFEKISNNLLEIMIEYLNKSDDEIKNLKEESYNLSQNFTWEIFIKNYLIAYDFALNKK